ncbi:MAG: leucine-rich repeat domain-containing protein, partial [Spirochaetaceae bacterium]|nr:leucine-rich repeat domain-containing protein [Spirochaetaceae bacterium]
YDVITIDYQYKATYTLPTDEAPHEVFYYKRDGIILDLPPLSPSEYTVPDSNGIVYHANKYSVQGQVVSSGNVRINSSGDVSFDIMPTGDTTYGFRLSDSTLVVNQTSGTVVIDNSGGQTFEKIQLPASAADGSISLDLSGVTELNLVGDDGGAVGAGSTAITNGSKLGSVTMHNTSFPLGFGAFKDCNRLTSIDLSNCTSLGTWAFYGCSGLTSINLSNITSIEQYAFENCTGLTGNINLASCNFLDIGVFKGCSGITSVTLPVSITSLGDYTFTECSSLASIDLSNCTIIGEAALYGCSSFIGNVNLSACTSIGDYAFSECTGITRVNFSSSINSIGAGAFYNVDASFDFSTKDPHDMSFVSGTFKNGVAADFIYYGNPTITYWNDSSAAWLP